MLASVFIAAFYRYRVYTVYGYLTLRFGMATFFHGALLGIFLIGFISRSRGSSLSNLLGAAISIVAVIAVKYNTEVGWPWFIVIGTLVTVAIGMLGRTASAVVAEFAEFDDEE